MTRVHLTFDNVDPMCTETPPNSRYTLVPETVDLLTYDFYNSETQVCRRCAAALFEYGVMTQQEGQPRPFADSVYKYVIQDQRRDGDPRTRDEVLWFAVRFLRPGVWASEMTSPFDSRIVQLSETRSRYWFYHVQSLYTG